MDIKHIKKSKLISIAITFVLLVGLTIGVVNMTGNKAQASCSAGIMNNGLNGIYIDINSAPYTTLATTTGVAYRRGGCAWFASSRARELTGKNIIIHGPANWLNSKYALYGFTRGSQPRAKSLAIYPNHVFVVEEINGDTATISEGATPISDPAHGYCVIRTLPVSSLAGLYGGIRGYVYLGVGGGSKAGATGTAKSGTGYYKVDANGSNLNMRSSDRASASILGKVPDNTRVYVSDISNGMGKIVYNGLTGWVQLTWITKA